MVSSLFQKLCQTHLNLLLCDLAVTGQLPCHVLHAIHGLLEV